MYTYRHVTGVNVKSRNSAGHGTNTEARSSLSSVHLGNRFGESNIVSKLI